jgi:hypothetical protein
MASVNPILLESFERWSLVQTMLDKVPEYMRLKLLEAFNQWLKWLSTHQIEHRFGAVGPTKFV